jgi:hypothetical protein
MLHNLGLPMVRYRASGTDVPCFFWCGYDPMRFDGLPTHRLTIAFYFHAAFAVLMVLLWALPHLPVIPVLRSTLEDGVQWIALSVSLNIIVTSMICFRLLRMRALLRQVLNSEMSRMYTNIAAMLVESSAPLSIIGVGLLVTSAHNGQLVHTFAYVWAMFYVSVRPESFRAYSLL